MSPPDNPLIFRVTQGFLRAGRVVDATSTVLLLVTLLGVLGVLAGLTRAAAAPELIALGLALALGLLAKYYAWRIALDAEFFGLLADQPQQAEAFDAALTTFLGRKNMPPPRTLENRWQGARRLVVRQALVVAGQLLAVGALLLLY